MTKRPTKASKAKAAKATAPKMDYPIDCRVGDIVGVKGVVDKDGSISWNLATLEMVRPHFSPGDRVRGAVGGGAETGMGTVISASGDHIWLALDNSPNKPVTCHHSAVRRPPVAGLKKEAGR